MSSIHQQKSSCSSPSASDERGATLVEYVIGLACFALIMTAGVPKLETAVDERLDEGTSIWESYNFELPS